MRALLLCAGEGTRLRPLTLKIPKVLVPINKTPLLSYWLENLSKVGIDKFLINTSYLKDQIDSFIQHSPYNDKIVSVYEPILLNTGGTVLANREFFLNEAFMLVHADNLCFCDFKAFIDSHQNRPSYCEITMMLFYTDNPSSCGIVELDEKGVVQNFYEKIQNPLSNLANGAVYICEPSVIDFMATINKKNLDFSLDVLPRYMGKISTFLNNVYHRDIGTMQSYKQSLSDIKKFV